MGVSRPSGCRPTSPWWSKGLEEEPAKRRHESMDERVDMRETDEVLWGHAVKQDLVKSGASGAAAGQVLHD